jgi:hypothetical protein
MIDFSERRLGSSSLVLENPLSRPFDELEAVALPWSVRRLDSGWADPANKSILSGCRKEDVKYGLLCQRDRNVTQKSPGAHVFGRSELFKRSAAFILTLELQDEPHAHADVSATFWGLRLNLVCEPLLQFGEVHGLLEKTASSQGTHILAVFGRRLAADYKDGSSGGVT